MRTCLETFNLAGVEACPLSCKHMSGIPSCDLGPILGRFVNFPFLIVVVSRVAPAHQAAPSHMYRRSWRIVRHVVCVAAARLVSRLEQTLHGVVVDEVDPLACGKVCGDKGPKVVPQLQFR